MVSQKPADKTHDMKYLEADFKIKGNEELLATARELLADAAGEAGFESFEDTDEGLRGYVQQELIDQSALDESIRLFPLADITIEYDLYEVEDRNWNSQWEAEGFEPIVVADRVIIYDAKHTLASSLCRKDARQLLIGIDAVQAFGTGNHETTRMIVEQLLKLPLQDKRVLDCGCGTGILSIVMLKLGAHDAVGYDIDEWSVENSRHNAEVNQVAPFEVYHGDASVLSHISGEFDVVVANINRNTLLHDLHAFKDVMAQGGQLILSGFYTDDAPILLDRAQEFDLHETARYEDNNWCCLVLTAE